MGFRFPLATVLRFRENIERREELALQKIQLEMAQVRYRIEQLTEQIASTQDAREKSMRQPIPAAQLQSMLSEAQLAVEQRKTLHASLQSLEQRRELQMKAYQAAHRGRQTLTDIRTRQQDAYDLQQVKSQQKLLDDLFVARHQGN